MYFRCITPSFMEISANDIQVDVPEGSYSLTAFIQQLNTQISIVPVNRLNGMSLDGTFLPINLKDDKFDIVVNMSKIFKEQNFTVTIDETSLLHQYMGFPLTTDADLSLNNVFSGTFPVSYSGYILDTRHIMTLKAKNTNYGNKNQPDVRVELITQGLSFGTYTELVIAINQAMDSYVIHNNDIDDHQTVLTESTMTDVTDVTITNVTATLTVKYTYHLNEANYQLEFNSNNLPMSDTSNTWSPFYLESSYNLYDYISTTTPNTASSDISGSAIISQNLITVTDVNNSIYIRPYEDPLGGAYTPSNNITLTIPTGTYTLSKIYEKLNELFQANPYTTGTSISTLNLGRSNQFVKLRLNVNRIYTSSDYNLVFYDPFSFVRCTPGSGTIQNTTWDTTLGWILGYRSYTQYTLTTANQRINSDTGVPYYLQSFSSVYNINPVFDTSRNNITTNNVIDFISDTTLTTTLYNYFVISLDDYNQNRINDGLVSITRSETSILAPTYINQTVKVCDPVTGKVINRAVKQPDGSNLSAVEMYSISQSVSSQTNAVKTYSAGPFIKDLFGYVPIKAGTNGTYFIEYGGSLQSQERLYFGPVNIRKMSIELLNDHGQLVDLNGSNWSFSFICEQLYRGSNSGASK
jgi:hypothetical protein